MAWRNLHRKNTSCKRYRKRFQEELKLGKSEEIFEAIFSLCSEAIKKIAHKEQESSGTDSIIGLQKHLLTKRLWWKWSSFSPHWWNLDWIKQEQEVEAETWLSYKDWLLCFNCRAATNFIWALISSCMKRLFIKLFQIEKKIFHQDWFHRYFIEKDIQCDTTAYVPVT